MVEEDRCLALDTGVELDITEPSRRSVQRRLRECDPGEPGDVLRVDTQNCLRDEEIVSEIEVADR